MLPHPIIPNNIDNLNILCAIAQLLKLGSKTQLKPETFAATNKLKRENQNYFFTSDLIRHLEGAFQSDGVHASKSPNALFGKRLKRSSVEKQNCLPIQQIYYKKGTSEESFPIYDDIKNETSSALWVLTCTNIEIEIEKLKVI